MFVHLQVHLVKEFGFDYNELFSRKPSEASAWFHSYIKMLVQVINHFTAFLSVNVMEFIIFSQDAIENHLKDIFGELVNIIFSVK